MANKQDIITAIKNLDTFLKIPELKGAEVRLNSNGNPFVFTGGFNMVFQLTKEFQKWALRVWHVPMGSTKDRYQAISNYLTEKDLPYFADFIYDEKGILVGGEFLDTIRMEWLDGLLFKEYLEENINNKTRLAKLADDFLVMCQALRDNNISHGDLQEGNILVNETGEIKLVDYDSIYVPTIEGENEFVTGLKGYQHPSRFKKNKVSIKADYFSELIIYITIKALEVKPKLWEKYQLKDTSYLLFSDSDFLDLENSQIYSDLKGLTLKLDALLSILKKYLNTNNYTDLKPFQSYLLPPKIIEFKVTDNVLLKGGEITMEWEVENAISVEINNGIGTVSNSGRISLKPEEDLEYAIRAIGYNKTIERRISLNVFPTPLINSIQVPVPIFNQTTNLNIKMPAFPKQNLGISRLENSIKLNIKGIAPPPQFNHDHIKTIELKNQHQLSSGTKWSVSSILNKIFKQEIK
jgi:serine/threonine protein kinase